MRFDRLFFLGMVLCSFSKGGAQTIPVRFFRDAVVKDKPVKQVEYRMDFGDSTGSDILYQNLTRDGTPVSYSRAIKTSVCFDGKCRLLDIAVYWDPAGGYMGFEMPPGEFLSKTDHDPFSHEEYLKLHGILSDSLSPLADYTFEELVPGTGDPGEADAVSSATLKDILEYIVPGAAFTTYRLWHIVYGKTREAVSRLSSDIFTDRLALMLLDTGEPRLQCWALDRLTKLPDWEEEVTQKVLALTGSANLNVSASAIASFSRSMADRKNVQAVLAGLVSDGAYAVRKPAIQKLKDAGTLRPETVSFLAETASRLNGDLLGEVLNLFLARGVADVNTLRKISEILETGNRYAAGKALDFLEKVNPKDALVRRRIQAFRK
ncbi:MAG: hypothetical protein ABS46_15450 [Cytophagaceae bacterium SCN 52-12]|nr:MAG: hypothetical protein ABS46_15450 [Cytophagaceae bacterium SCN 52-12]